MDSPKDMAEIEFVEAIADAADDSAFAVRCEIRGPKNQFEAMRISFTDDFFRDYFHILLTKDLAAEEKRLIKEKREFFMLLALVKVEQHIDWKTGASKIEIASEDVNWAKKVASGAIKPVSEKKTDHLYYFRPRNQ